MPWNIGEFMRITIKDVLAKETGFGRMLYNCSFVIRVTDVKDYYNTVS